MATYYEPHHANLEKAVAAALGQFGHCLIIDIHSFSSTPLPHELDQSVGRPEICIGFDQFHSPFNESSDLKQVCGEHGFTAVLNRPFSGSIVPSTYWNIDARVRSFMIEIRRDMYMEEATGLKRVDFPVTSRRVCSLVEELAGIAGALPSSHRSVWGSWRRQAIRPASIALGLSAGRDSVRRRAQGFGGSSGVFAAGAGAGAAASP